jgi:hypothetical protein
MLATLARHWRLRPAPGANVEAHPRITLRPKGSVPMIPERRTQEQ